MNWQKRVLDGSIYRAHNNRTCPPANSAPHCPNVLAWQIDENLQKKSWLQKYFPQLTEMMEWLQRLKRARSSPAPGASMPTDENKSAEKNMSFAEKSSVFTAKASFNHSLSSVAAMKMTLFGFSKSCLKVQQGL